MKGSDLKVGQQLIIRGAIFNTFGFVLRVAEKSVLISQVEKKPVFLPKSALCKFKVDGNLVSANINPYWNTRLDSWNFEHYDEVESAATRFFGLHSYKEYIQKDQFSVDPARPHVIPFIGKYLEIDAPNKTLIAKQSVLKEAGFEPNEFWSDWQGNQFKVISYDLYSKKAEDSGKNAYIKFVWRKKLSNENVDIYTPSPNSDKYTDKEKSLTLKVLRNM